MKTQTIFKMFFGILVGILVSLLITLNFWGQSFMKIALSIIPGAIFGMFITDFKLALQILKNVALSALNLFKEISSINLNPMKVSKRMWIVRYLNFKIILNCLFYVALVGYFVLNAYLSAHSGDGYAFVYMVIFYYFIFVAYYSSFLYSGVGFAWGITKKVWKNEKAEDKSRWFNKNEDGTIYFTDLVNITLEKGILFVEKKSLLTFFYIYLFTLWGIWIAIKKTIAFCIFLVFNLISTIILILIMLPLYFFRELWKHSKMLIVVISITIGAIIGNIYFSYLMGISSGFLVLGISILINSLFRDTNFFFYWEKPWNKSRWKKVLSI